jgi:hypothetical protein
MSDTILGYLKGAGTAKACDVCGNTQWILSESNGDSVWYLCAHCGRRAPVKGLRDGRKVPENTKQFETVEAATLRIQAG